MTRPKTSSNDIKHATKELQGKWAIIKRIWEAHFPNWEIRLGSVYRSPEDQYLAFKRGASQLDGFKKVGKHNKYPSEAIDANVYEKSSGKWIVTLLDQKKITRDQFNAMYAVFGLLGHAHGLRWGNDWDGDLMPVGPDPDESFVDVYHLETR